MMRQRGFSLIELMMVLVFVALASAALLRLWPSMDQSASHTRFYNDLVGLQAEVRELYAGQLDYTGLSAADVIARGSVPAGVLDRQNGALRTPWGEALLLSPATLAGDTGAPSASAALIRFSVASLADSEKQATCRALMPRLAEQFDTIDIGGSSLGQQVVAGGADLPSATRRAQIDSLCESQILVDPWMGGTFQ